MQQHEAVETDIGVLWGRDCIFLNGVEMPSLSTLRLIGTINVRIVGGYRPPRGWEKVKDLPYVLDFSSVLGFQMMELDAWGLQEPDQNALVSSSLERVVNSSWVQSLEKAITAPILPELVDYQFATYDSVFDVICSGYQLRFGADGASHHTGSDGNTRTTM